MYGHPISCSNCNDLNSNMLKDYNKVQLMFGFDMIIPIKYNAYWELIRQINQAYINNDNNQDNIKRLDYH